MVSIMVFIDFMVAIIGGMIVSIWGIRASRRSMSTVSAPRSSLSLSIPSSESNTDRNDWQTGMSKQCGSQYR